MITRPASPAALLLPSPTTTPVDQDWRATAHALLDLCATPANLGWAFREAPCFAAPPPQNDPAAHATKEPAAKPDCSSAVQRAPEDTDDCEDDGYDPFLGLDDLFEDNDTVLTQLRRQHNPRAGRVPRVLPLLLALQLARCFGTVAQMQTHLAARGAIVMLATGGAQNHDTIVKMLAAVLDPHRRSGSSTVPLICTVAHSATARSGKTHDQPFSSHSEEMRDALELGRPIVLVAASPAGLSQDLCALAPTIIQLPALDEPILREIFRALYPTDANADTDRPVGIDEAAPDPALPGQHDLARLTLEDLILALRAPSAAAAVERLTITLAPAPASAPRPGLADFPMSAAVRSAIDQLLADLRDWRAGTLPWSAVSRGLLLIGPPGCGKTEIPRLIAAEAGIAVHATSLAQLQASGARSSDTVREMRGLFGKAAAEVPAIVFIDELDAFGDRGRPHDHNSSWTDAIVAGLLECLDGFESLEGIVTIAATNHIDKIDAALRRPGRFDRQLLIAPPDPELMPQAFRWHLGQDLADKDLTPVVAAAIGMSGAEIARTVRSARATARAAKRALSRADLADAIAVTHPALTPELRRRVAIHEAGHAVVAIATGRRKPQRLLLHSAGGIMQSDDLSALTLREDIEAELAIMLAGRVAEYLLLQKHSTGAGGPATSDLARATTLAASIEISLGLGKQTAWRAAPEDTSALLNRDPALRMRVQNHLDRAEVTALRILTTHQAQLNALAEELATKSILTGKALARHIATIAAPTK